LGAAIRRKQKRLGFTHERLAERADISPNNVGLVERGEEHVSLIALQRILNQTELPPPEKQDAQVVDNQRNCPVMFLESLPPRRAGMEC